MSKLTITIELDTDDLIGDELEFLREGRAQQLIADAMSDFCVARKGDYVKRRYAKYDWMSPEDLAAKQVEVDIRRLVAEKLRNAGLRAQTQVDD